ncbi:MAG: two-component regulator propeller domain-containing protein [Acidimicrobiia bacterium]
MQLRSTATALLVFCLLGATPAVAQYRFDTWTTEDGLPQNGVRAVTQTPDGFLWFTTFDGLVRFDGIRFTTFSTGNTKGIINNRFTGLYAAKDGTLYATTMEDGILTVVKNGEFTSYTSQQVPGHYIYRIAEHDNGELRFLVEDEERTTKSWYFLRNGAFVFSERDDPARIVTVTGPHGVVWKVSLTDATEISPNGTSTTYHFLHQPLPFRPNPFVDSKGNLWLGEYDVHRFGGGQRRRLSRADGLTRSIHHSFWEDADGSVWFSSGGGATEGNGLIRFRDNALQVFGTDAGLRSRSLWSVFHDREGTTWVATDKGLARLRRTVLSGYSVKDGLIHAETYPIFRDSKGVTWIGSSRGLSTYQNGTFAPARIVPHDRTAPMAERWTDERASVQSL